jgi:hypothetical protein
MDTESGMGCAGTGLQEKKLPKIIKDHAGKSKSKGADDE